MTIRTLPEAPAARPCARLSFDLPQSVQARWNPAIKAAAKDETANSISVFDPIGYDGWSDDGVTAKRIAAALRGMDGGDVIVNINSPGGDMFEGLAIYNLLREHAGKVTVKVLGVAASAASIIAMAGDEILIGRAAFLMIHNCWVYAAGNAADLREIASTLDPFDRAMAGIYAARTGMDQKAVEKLLGAETWIGGADAVAQGFAESLLDGDSIEEDTSKPTKQKAALKAADTELARAGVTRAERRRLFHQLTSTPSGAAPDATPGAGSSAASAASTVDLLAAIARLGAATTPR